MTRAWVTEPRSNGRSNIAVKGVINKSRCDKGHESDEAMSFPSPRWKTRLGLLSQGAQLSRFSQPERPASLLVTAWSKILDHAAASSKKQPLFGQMGRGMDHGGRSLAASQLFTDMIRCQGEVLGLGLHHEGGFGACSNTLHMSAA